MLKPTSRQSGIEFAVGCFLFALGIGLLIPRPGVGLYSLIKSGGMAWLWASCLILSSLFIILASFYDAPRLRGAAVFAAMCCWTALAFRFVEASLWGAALQSINALFLLNGCFFHLVAAVRRME